MADETAVLQCRKHICHCTATLAVEQLSDFAPRISYMFLRKQAHDRLIVIRIIEKGTKQTIELIGESCLAVEQEHVYILSQTHALLK